MVTRRADTSILRITDMEALQRGLNLQHATICCLDGKEYFVAADGTRPEWVLTPMRR